jgi:predicted alpha/beta-fold hydrolase
MLSKADRFSRRYWLRLVTFTISVLALPLLVMLLYLLQRQVDILVTPVRQPLTQTPVDINLPFQEVTLTSSDGLKLAAWYIPGRQAQAVILVHGLNSNRTAMLPAAAILAEAGYQLLLLDLRGHGQSEGDLISYGYREALDVQAGAAYLAALPGVEKIGAVGSSLGGAAVARAAAADQRLSAVVIQTSYSSLPAAVDDALDDLSIFSKWPLGSLVVTLAERRVGIKIGQVDSARDLATINPRPVLIIHSWIIESLGPGDPAIAYEAEYRMRVVTFFEKALTSSPD